MKGMDKISRGSGFAGTTRYLQDGHQNQPREYAGILIGGNVANRDAKLVAQELASTTKIRPDVSKPVWHSSLRLPKDETLANSKWSEIGDEYMRRMGFSNLHPRAYYLHNDKEGQHIHIVASRIAYDGKLYLGKNENLRSTKIIKGLEKVFGLNQTKGVEYQRGSISPRMNSKLTKNEIEKAVRLEKEPARRQLQKMVSEAIKRPISATNFVELLQAGGVDVRANIASTGRLNGFKFGLQDVWFSGSKLGQDFSLAALVTKGLSYDKDRDREFLSKFRADVGDNKGYARAAERLTEVRHEIEPAVTGVEGSEGLVGATNRENPRSEGERIGSNYDFTGGGELAGHGCPATPITPSGAVGPGKSGNTVADELARALHWSRLEELRNGIQLSRRYWQDRTQQESTQQVRKIQDEQSAQNRQKRDDAAHEEIVRIAEHLGFAMKTKIITTKVKKDGAVTAGKKTRKNTFAVSGDAAPRGQ